MSKSKERFLARSLRKGGLSLNEISKKLKISKGSASLWCSDIKLTKKQIQKLHEQMVRGSYAGRMIGVQAQKERKKNKIKECLFKAKRDILNLKEKELFLSGLSLYWGEGAKNGSNVRFYNSNPSIIKFAMKWLRESIKVEEDSFLMYVNINEIHARRLGEVTEYWSEIAGVPIRQFRKPTLIKTKNKKEYDNFSNHYGTLSIRIAKSKYLLYQILAWIEVLSEAG